MVKMIANEPGYYGKEIKNVDDVFIVDENDPKAPRWARLAKGETWPAHWGEPLGPVNVETALFGGKGDHDKNGKTGGAKAKTDAPAKVAPVIPADWRTIKAAEKRKLADAIFAYGDRTEKHANATEAEATIEAFLEANKPAPFEEAPAPETAPAAGNGIVDALGGPAPDWVAPVVVDNSTGNDEPVVAADE